MPNNQEFYCKHCGKETLFFLESDMLWYCDECGHVLDSIPDDEHEFEDEVDLPVVRCSSCNNLVRVDEIVDGQYCPICYEDLSEELEEVYEENED